MGGFVSTSTEMSNIEKIDDRYYVVNNHDVMKLARFKDRWVCDCESWIYNFKYGEKGDCKHILQVKQEKERIE